MNKLMISIVIAGFAATVIFQCASAQTAYVVGDSLGWGIPQNGASAYTSWASGKQFMVGDILIFNFATNQHDVQQVQRDSYDACTSTNSIGNAIMNGPANITLTSSGENYYICTFGLHCNAGQKLAINVSGTPVSSPPSTTTTPPPSAPSPTSPEAVCPPPESTNTPSGSPAVPTTPRGVDSPPNSSSPSAFTSLFVLFFGFVITATSL